MELPLARETGKNPHASTYQMGFCSWAVVVVVSRENRSTPRATVAMLLGLLVLLFILITIVLFMILCVVCHSTISGVTRNYERRKSDPKQISCRSWLQYRVPGIEE